jgi:dihydroxyacetone kinase-like predicted kinase
MKTNTTNINEVIDRTVVGKVSISSKPIQYSHIEIKKNHFIGILNKKIVVADYNMVHVLNKLSDLLVDEVRRPKNAYIIYGNDAQMRDIKLLKKYLTETHSLKVSIINGNQPTYSFYIAIQ